MVHAIANMYVITGSFTWLSEFWERTRFVFKLSKFKPHLSRTSIVVKGMYLAKEYAFFIYILLILCLTSILPLSIFAVHMHMFIYWLTNGRHSHMTRLAAIIFTTPIITTQNFLVIDWVIYLIYISIQILYVCVGHLSLFE